MYIVYSLECATSTTANAAIHTNKLNPVSRLALVDEVVIQNHICTPRKLSCGGAFWHLLNAYSLVVTEGAEAKFRLQRMPFFIGLGGNRRCWGRV